MDEKEPQLQEEKTKSWLIKIKDDFIKFAKEETFKFIFGAFFLILFTVLMGNFKELYHFFLAPAAEVINCPMGNLDEITGEIHLKGEIKRGGEIKFKVHNKIKGIWEETLINETIDNTDGTFKFHFCKAVTDYVRFDIKILGREIPKEYAVDEIPAIIPLN